MQHMAETAQQRQCGSKVIYEGEKEARKAAKAAHKRFKAPCRAYSCQFCYGWHVGRVRSREAAIRRNERLAA